MANWTGVITNAGNMVLNKWVNEKVLTFDYAAAGQGTVNIAGLLAQTSLVSQRQEASVAAISSAARTRHHRLATGHPSFAPLTMRK